jgi:CheY-like chemotaxis protein
MMQELNKQKICNVLLAEDDEDDFYFFNLALSSLNGTFQLLRASDGVMFSSLIQCSLNTDIIFLDINMPYKNGISCLKEIRTIENYNSIKVVMYSTSSNINEIDRCYNMGADFYLIKPLCYSGAQQQLKGLFENNYFRSNTKPPREEFVINTSNQEQNDFATMTN